GKRVATGHFRNYISIWNLENGKLEQRFSTQPGFVACIAWSPDGQCLASGSNSAPSLLLWHPKSGKRVATLDRHKKRIVALSFSSDGKLLVSGGEDGIIWLWDVGTKKPLHRFLGHDSWVTSLSFSKDDKVILSRGTDRRAILWDRQSGKRIRTIDNVVSPVAYCSETDCLAI